jgi:hypothetical protein
LRNHQHCRGTGKNTKANASGDHRAYTMLNATLANSHKLCHDCLGHGNRLVNLRQSANLLRATLILFYGNSMITSSAAATLLTLGSVNAIAAMCMFVVFYASHLQVEGAETPYFVLYLYFYRLRSVYISMFLCFKIIGSSIRVVQGLMAASSICLCRGGIKATNGLFCYRLCKSLQRTAQ